MKSAVLILTNPEDAHTYAVREALQRKGTDARLWHTGDFPKSQCGSFWLSDRQESWEIGGANLDLRRMLFSSVWVRRPEPPGLPSGIDPADRDFALRECVLFRRSLYREIGVNALWVNPFESQGRASLKTEQLKAAARHGFKIPRTLCSNDPRQIRRFIASHAPGVVYKSFHPMVWHRSDGARVLFTSMVKECDLPDDDLLRVSPGIFQEFVPKKFELRITVVGAELFVAKFLSQAVPDAVVDWRAGGHDVPIEPARIPTEVASACREVMADLGLIFGCFDLIVTPEDDYVFLEVNEMGAFLWIEHRIPELRMLDAFCELLLQGTPHFRWTHTERNVRFADVIDLAEARMKLEARGRVETSI